MLPGSSRDPSAQRDWEAPRGPRSPAGGRGGRRVPTLPPGGVATQRLSESRRALYKYPLRIPLGVVTNKNREKDLATIGTKSPQSGASAFLVPRTAPGAEEVV